VACDVRPLTVTLVMDTRGGPVRRRRAARGPLTAGRQAVADFEALGQPQSLELAHVDLIGSPGPPRPLLLTDGGTGDDPRRQRHRRATVTAAGILPS
jgi:hypothetical protein